MDLYNFCSDSKLFELVKNSNSCSDDKLPELVSKITFLLLSGAKINQKDLDGNTLLHIGPHAIIIGILYAWGINPLIKNNLGLLPIDIENNRNYKNSFNQEIMLKITIAEEANLKINSKLFNLTSSLDINSNKKLISFKQNNSEERNKSPLLKSRLLRKTTSDIENKK